MMVLAVSETLGSFPPRTRGLVLPKGKEPRPPAGVCFGGSVGRGGLQAGSTGQQSLTFLAWRLARPPVSFNSRPVA
jgi:hypothetical protein